MGDRFSAIADRHRDRARWTRGIVTGSLITLTLLGWGIRACVRHQEEELIEDSHRHYQAYVEASKRMDEEALAMPALERQQLPGMSIEAPLATLDKDSSAAWGRLESSRLDNFMSPRSSGVYVEWREGRLAGVALPMPGDPVQSLFARNGGPSQVPVTDYNGNKVVTITLGTEIHGIATYLECNGRIVTILVWHKDVKPLMEKVVGSFRCGA